jgi:hypothetical protein
MGLYANQCPSNKNGKRKKYDVARSITCVEEYSSQFETTFSMVSCFPSNTMSSVEWYVDSGASRHLNYAKSLFNRL